LNKIKKSIAFCVNHFKPDFVLYDAGIDIHKFDELGKLNIDDDGCLERDLIVLSYLKNLSIPVATVIGGGYSKDKKDLAKRHSIIFKAADHVFS
jgi:acetoin utilization deacetylase AcuC-like enzyme